MSEMADTCYKDSYCYIAMNSVKLQYYSNDTPMMHLLLLQLLKKMPFLVVIYGSNNEKGRKK